MSSRAHPVAQGTPPRRRRASRSPSGSPSSLRGCPGRASRPCSALVGVTAIWGYTFVPVQDAVAVYPLFAFLAVRFGISTLVLAPFAWRSLRVLPRRGIGAGVGAGVLLATAYGLQTAGLELTTVSSTGFITGLYVVLTPLLALALFRTPVAAAAWVGVALAVAGLLLLNGVPGGSAVGQRARARQRGRPVVSDRGDGAVCAPLRRPRAHVPADGGCLRRLHRDRALPRRALDAARRHGLVRRSSSRASSRARSATSSPRGCSPAPPPRVPRSCSRSRRRSPRCSASCCCRSGSGLAGWAGCGVMLAGNPARGACRGGGAAPARATARLMDAVAPRALLGRALRGDDRRAAPCARPWRRPAGRRLPHGRAGALRRARGGGARRRLGRSRRLAVRTRRDPRPGCLADPVHARDPRGRAVAHLGDRRDGAALRGDVRDRPARRAARRRHRSRRRPDRRRRASCSRARAAVPTT